MGKATPVNRVVLPAPKSAKCSKCMQCLVFTYHNGGGGGFFLICED